MNRRLRDLPLNWLGLTASIGFWCLLWGGVDAKNVLGGLAVALLVFVLFPMPPTGREITVRPLALIICLGRFLADIVVSSVQVAWYAVRPGPQPPSAVIAVPLASRSDLFLTGTAMLATLIPGSVIVEAQRSTGTLFLHVIGARTAEDAERARRRVLAQERRLLRALARRDILEEAGLA
ncbi:Na+/H+ antiporter subunit E [Brachybacterium phenoliresistens]|uniref:Sodium:proton antiporter n=1 Tax=Brachybacterium phenoliresistens TaxID=396014 RepID=Z9JSR6_9MICO|nr:Na+/H+ antiporter subunit E [Brachybacterium phenoliresistens]EWS81028.1 sodium:proton antiporter [Brachybacterium phenoliresistens]